MKKITLLFALLISSIGFSQTYDLIKNGDFANGTDNWTGTDFTIVSGEAFISTTNAAGNPWDSQLVQGSLEFEDAKEYVLTFSARAAADRTITVAIQNVGAWNDQFRSDYNLTTTMTEFTSTFNSTSANANVQLGFLLAAAGSTDAIYFDNISLVTAGTAPTNPEDPKPTTAAPTPPARNAWDVVSLFSNAYTNTTVESWSASWDDSDQEDIQVAGDDVKKISFSNFLGVEFLNNRIDATPFTHFHIDIFTNTATLDKSFNLKLSNWAGGSAEANAVAFSTTNASSPALPNPNPGTWISLDMPFTSWTAGAREDIAQFIITSNLGVVYVDNIYMYRAATAGVDKNNLLNVSLYPSPASNNLKISAQEVISDVTIYNVLGKKVKSAVINKTSDDINISSLKAGIYVLKYTANNKVGTLKFVKQ